MRTTVDYHDLATSSSIVLGALFALALILVAAEHIASGAVDSVLLDVVSVLATALVTSITAERVARQLQSGKPVINGLHSNSPKTGHESTGGTNGHTDTEKGS